MVWSLSSISTPLPNWIPSLQSVGATVGYKYDDIKDRPSFFEGILHFRPRLGRKDNSKDIYNAKNSLSIDIGPAYEVRDRRLSCITKIGSDKWNIFARFSGEGKQILQYIRASYRTNLPFQSVGAFSITPSYNFFKSEPACSITGKSGTGRTATILDLNMDDPTLSIMHALDERNTIAPEISLNSGKITYNWNVDLKSGTLQTRVDPITAIQVTWIDKCMNGKWVTDFRLPLASGNTGSLGIDIRVRRQFTF
eukprot:CAMPEP_0184857728 /NCGR_PEP_ID=MMETSP0580-20130426/2877_1 /TAXON_ID=1118495 /ORGANISM="Dactyliosolen fragilissimus" /LENGTH=251 /DNA_ID=CAMNT_0027353489 /DNA_START=429 /DNA_END=1184 /DNA_ORIENTATION=+